jgi:trimeric autotransporter adhesin
MFGNTLAAVVVKRTRMPRRQHIDRARVATWAGIVTVAAAVILPVSAQQAPPACTISGRAASGAAALPGVSLVAFVSDAVKAATSTDLDGTYRLTLPPGSYDLTAELTGFDPVRRDLVVGGGTCDQTIDLQLALKKPTTQPAVQAARQAAQRFETLAVQTQAGAASADATAPEREALDQATRLLLPPGFSTDAPTEAVAVTGAMASIDRSMMNQRFEAIGRGEFDPVTGAFTQGFGPGGRGSPGDFGGPGGRGGPGEGRGGRGGAGAQGFTIGGRGGRQNVYAGNATYTFGGSAIDSSPYQLRAGSQNAKRPYTRQNFNVAFGGPVRIPGVYNGTRRTTFNATYGGNRGSSLFDQYATVPTEQMRAGDFSFAALPVFDPVSGQPFPGNQVPAGSVHPAARVLLDYIPLPNLPGATRNFHHSTTSQSSGDNVNVRISHNFTPAVAGGRGGGRGGAGGGGRLGGLGGRGGRGQQGTSVVLNTQLQYRRNESDQVNVLPTLGGRNEGSTLSVPIGLTVMRRGMMHNVNVSVTRTRSNATNQYAFVEDVAGRAGISGVATDPFDWGVPALSFAGLSAVRDLTPSRRTDTRVATSYTWTRPTRTHTLRIGGDFRFDRSRSQADSNARGAFVFTGLYASGGRLTVPRASFLDFADFLLGLPQQASVQFGPGHVEMRGRSMSLFVQDDWRKSGTLTFNLGIRYELLWPFLERNGHMVNLDTPPDFSAAVPVTSGGAGPFGGRFPDALMNADANNLAPRVGVAWRAKPGTVVRGGYGISFNSGSYAAIARQLVAQPPFAVSNTSLGTPASPLSLSDPLSNATPTGTANNYGVARDYALGLVQTWNGDISRDFGQVWNVGAGYTHTRGSSLDIVRAPNRGPDGLRIEGVQPFLWQTSEGSSTLHAGTVRARRRPVRGIGGGLTYTLARSRDNASTIGGGGTVVAQDDRNLAAEWGLSSFDRRHQLSVDVNIELPFGPNRPWLSGGGFWSRALENWRLNASYIWQAGTPLTARTVGAAADVSRGTNGTLRADYDGGPVPADNPTIDRFFNVEAFSVPAAGLFGTAGRNTIIGPGSRLLNAQLARDVRLGGNRSLGVTVNASNLLNTVNYANVDTNVNSPSFGQVTSVRPMRAVQLNARFRF